MSTGECNVEMSQSVYMELQVSWALQKKSPYIDSINLGYVSFLSFNKKCIQLIDSVLILFCKIRCYKRLMRMREAGLISKWYKDSSPDVHQCIQKKKDDSDQSNVSPLKLYSLLGAFLFLFIGYVAALFFFVKDRIMFALSKKK